MNYGHVTSGAKGGVREGCGRGAESLASDAGRPAVERNQALAALTIRAGSTKGGKHTATRPRIP